MLCFAGNYIEQHGCNWQIPWQGTIHLFFTAVKCVIAMACM